MVLIEKYIRKFLHKDDSNDENVVNLSNAECVNVYVEILPYSGATKNNMGTSVVCMTIGYYGCV